jgi:hypothetical protein
MSTARRFSFTTGVATTPDLILNPIRQVYTRRSQ